MPNSLFTLSYLANLILAESFHLGMPWSACECWLNYSLSFNESKIFIRLCDRKAPRPKRYAALWAYAYDETIEEERGMDYADVPEHRFVWNDSICEWSSNEVREALLFELSG